MPQENSRKRNANLDLLRILSMLLIVLLHAITRSGVLEPASGLGTATFFCGRFLYMMTQVGVNMYVMLSGYFLVRSKFRLKKLVTIWMEVVFYSVVIKLIFMLAGKTPFSLIALLSCFFPFLTGRYWFVTIYVGLYILFPFLNLAITAMNRRQHLLLNVVLVLLFSVWSSIHPSIAGMNSGGSWGLAWFVVLYFLAAWFGLYYDPSGKRLRYALLWIGLSAFVAFLYCFPGGKIPIVRVVAGNWYHYNALPTVLATVSLFVCFLNVEFKNESLASFVTKIAPATFGVYLIHAHANMAPFVWGVLDFPGHVGPLSFFAYLLLAVLGVYCACTVVDLLRARTIGRLENTKFVQRICSGIEQKVSDCLNKM